MAKITITQEEYELRKQLGLPVTKQLRYMRRDKGTYNEIEVATFEIIETFPSDWSTLRIILIGGGTVLIHSLYFAEMQKPSFERDMAQQEQMTD